MEKTTKAKNKNPSGKLSPDQYNDILKGLVLKNVRISSAQFKSASLRGKTELSVDMSYAAEWQKSKEKLILITAHCQFVAREESSNDEAVRISADYEVLLKTTNEFTNEFFAIYKDLSLPINVWPFFREFVQSILGRIGYPPYTLPLLVRPNFTPTIQKQKRVNAG
jgi:hypothetical protein